MLAAHLLKTKKKFKDLKKWEIQDIFFKKKLDKTAFQRYVAYGELKIYQEE